MEDKDRIRIVKLFKAKEEFHKDLAKLPFEQKIEILVRMQEIANNIRGSRKQKQVWKIK